MWGVAESGGGGGWRIEGLRAEILLIERRFGFAQLADRGRRVTQKESRRPEMYAGVHVGCMFRKSSHLGYLSLLEIC